MLSKLFARIACAAVTLMVVGLAALSAPLPTATAATPSAASASSAVLSEGVGLGARPSVRVRRVQRILHRRGFDLGPPGVDGRFGPLTAAAVRQMQQKYGLVADGMVGPKTRRTLSKLDAGRGTPHRAVQPTKPAQSTKPTKPTKPAQSTKPTKPAQSTKPTKPAQSTKPTKPAQSTKPTKPAKPQAQTPSAAPRPTPARPATHPRPATSGQRAQPPANQADRIKWPVILSILAAVLATAPLAAARLRRKRPASGPDEDHAERDQVTERQGDQPEIEWFGGMALASAPPHNAGEESGQTHEEVDATLEPAAGWEPGSELRRSPPQLSNGERVIGYVSPDPDQTREHEAFTQIEALCEQAGWELQEIIRDQDRGRTLDRPGLTRALEQIAAGDARALLVTDTRRVIDSLGDLAALLEWFRHADAALIAVDLDLDTSTVQGHEKASTLMTMAGWESERRTRRARHGLVEAGNRHHGGGHDPDDHARPVELIDAMAEAGMSLQAIADQLNEGGVPPMRGRAWRPADIKSTLANPPTAGSLRDELPSIPRQEQT